MIVLVLISHQKIQMFPAVRPMEVALMFLVLSAYHWVEFRVKQEMFVPIQNVNNEKVHVVLELLVVQKHMQNVLVPVVYIKEMA